MAEIVVGQQMPSRVQLLSALGHNLSRLGFLGQYTYKEVPADGFARMDQLMISVDR